MGMKLFKMINSELYAWDPVTEEYILFQRQTHINDPSGGATVDTEARTAIGSILDALEAVGILATS